MSNVKCQKIKRWVIDQYGAEPFEQQQFGADGVEGVNILVFLKILSNNNQSDKKERRTELTSDSNARRRQRIIFLRSTVCSFFTTARHVIC